MLTAIDITKGRAAVGLTQVAVASAVGVSVVAYRLWEYGGTKPTDENEQKLREVLKLGGSYDSDQATAG